MTKFSRISAVLLALITATAARSEPFVITATEMVNMCKAVPSRTKTQMVVDMNHVSCWAYVRGFADGFDALASILSKDSKTCFPQEATASMLADVVAKYYADHPARRHVSAQQIVGEALLDAYSCGGGEKS
jgi:hypothetical protein